MNRKLTLLLDEVTIEHAKQYAEKNKQSLSEMVERYFRYLTKTTGRRTKGTVRGIIAELSGIITVPDTLDVKIDYREHRAEKAMHG